MIGQATAREYGVLTVAVVCITTTLTGTTTFIVSQRAASIRHADRILVLDDGELVAQGTHDALLSSCEVYQEIYYSQYPKEAV